jgi:hypothetical protein
MEFISRFARFALFQGGFKGFAVLAFALSNERVWRHGFGAGLQPIGADYESFFCLTHHGADSGHFSACHAAGARAIGLWRAWGGGNGERDGE